MAVGWLTLSYFLLVFVPLAHNTTIIGFAGKWQQEKFVVTQVWEGSPAQLSGLQVGDTVVSQGRIPTSRWKQWYRDDVASYLSARADLRDTPVVYEAQRDGSRVILNVSPRPLIGSEMWTHYGFRTALILFLVGLGIYIVTAKARDRSAALIYLCFCVAVVWLASDEPYWPSFYAPVFRGTSLPVVYLVDLVEIVALQVVMSMLVHISLTFPEQRPILKRYPWLPVPLYVLSVAIPFIAMLFAHGTLFNRLTAVYSPRLWLNTGLLILATGLMLMSYRQCRSPMQRERTRWIIVAMAIVAITHLVFWNLPKLVSGQPLVPNYNWLLLPMALIPLALTVSITSHELFGVVGMIRGRIKLLQTLLRREKGMVVRRDQRIREMTEELGQLNSEMATYESAERPQGAPQDNLSKLKRLEQRYPELRRIRQQSLIGASKTWEDVFEQTAVAARGVTPVMIVGESGTGKTHIARAIHLFGDRKDRAYKAISCAQFEHADPAFALGKLFGIGTGHGLPNVPKEGQSGVLEECDGGTLFLDDFDRLPLNVQDLLLYPLEGKPFEPGIGRGGPRTASIKFVFATNREPSQLCSEGKFQPDVLARIGARIDIPPLRERSEDIPLLVEHFTRQICRELKHDITIISPKAMNLLSGYAYASGNARELQSELHKAIGKAILEDDGVLRAGYLSEPLQVAVPLTRATESQISTAPEAQYKPAVQELDKPGQPVELTVLQKHGFQLKPAERELGLSQKSRTLSNHLRGMCISALDAHQWELQRAARTLAGSSDPKIIARVEGKMRRYLKNIQDNVGRHTEKRLYNNLPAVYHGAMAHAIEKFREGM
jgi:transcriptional regulator with AAA-type ATPase domain